MINDRFCESIMRQWASDWRKNIQSCHWIRKSSTVHMVTLCDQMLHAFMSLLTLYCSAHLLIYLTAYDEVLCSVNTRFPTRPVRVLAMRKTVFKMISHSFFLLLQSVIHADCRAFTIAHISTHLPLLQSWNFMPIPLSICTGWAVLIQRRNIFHLMLFMLWRVFLYYTFAFSHYVIGLLQNFPVGYELIFLCISDSCVTTLTIRLF